MDYYLYTQLDCMTLNLRLFEEEIEYYFDLNCLYVHLCFPVCKHGAVTNSCGSIIDYVRLTVFNTIFVEYIDCRI